MSYYDGLGKPIQGLSNANSSKGFYGVSKIKYDELGRTKHEWLSVPMTSSCDYVSETAFSSSAASYYKDSKPYAQTQYDVLDRPLEKYLSGEDWYAKGKSMKYSYGSNAANDVRLFLAPLGSDKLEDKGFYTSGSLSMEKMTDEDGVAIELYTDMSGNKVLERRNGNNDTYYIYNDRDELRFVLPQGYLDASDDDAYDCFAYEYRYDGNGLCVWKKLPGCEPIKMWYDSFMRLAYSQDGNQRNKGQCLYKLYDSMGRICEEGLCPFSYAGLGNVGNTAIQTSSDVNEGGYDTHYSYDAMGNMLRLTRNSAFDDGGFETNDDVTFRYHGNQLVKSDNAIAESCEQGNFHVSDKVNTETEYFYDANGNMSYV